MPIEARLGSLTFRRHDSAADADGDRFILGALDGIESPEVDLVLAPRQPHGSYIGRARYGPRSVYLKGHAVASSMDNLWRTRRKLAAASDLVVASGTFFVDEPSPSAPVQMSVRRLEPIVLRPVSPIAVEFEIPLVAPDPRKLAQTLSQATAVAGSGTASITTVATNAGNFPTTWSVAVTIGAGGWAGGDLTIFNSTTGTQVKLVGLPALGAGDVITIDQAARTVVSIGADRFAYIDPAPANRGWVDLPPGNNTVGITRTNAANPMTAVWSFRSAWI